MERTEFFCSNSTSTNNNNNLLEPPKKKKNKDRDKNQRRFSDDQIKLLETMFESETRLEPKKKLELARELGLQPRQVAIWFQNRRARWKSKQIEQDFRALRAEYETLASKFESLKEEKKCLISQNEISILLLKQLQTLNDVLRNAHDENGKEGPSTSKIIDPKCEFANLSLEDKGVFDHTNNNFDDLSQQGDDELVVNTNQELDTSLASLENWYRHDLGGVLDQSRGFSQWFNFWS